MIGPTDPAVPVTVFPGILEWRDIVIQRARIVHRRAGIVPITPHAGELGTMWARGTMIPEEYEGRMFGDCPANAGRPFLNRRGGIACNLALEPGDMLLVPTLSMAFVSVPD